MSDSTNKTENPSGEDRRHTCAGSTPCSMTCETCGAALPDSDGEDAIAIVTQARAWLQIHGFDPDYEGRKVNDVPNAKKIGETLWAIISGAMTVAIKMGPFQSGGDHDVAEHTHGAGNKHSRTHTHAWASTRHSHFLRAVCGRPECKGFQTHDIHEGPTD